MQFFFFWFISDAKDIINFNSGLQISMIPITKKLFKHSLDRLMKFINESQWHIILRTFYGTFSAFFPFHFYSNSQSTRLIEP